MTLKVFGIVLFVVCMATPLACERGGATEQLPPLAAGNSIVLGSGQSVAVPSGTTIVWPDGTKVTLKGHHNIVKTTSGAVVTVSYEATGPADNIVIAE